ncbi:MAG TPA: inositol 2-dehydrogenase [Aggregatilineaceae bacterium]|nr:inositol 2-dehydrogenase [Aggregatilineaceae bacterium]
MNEKIRVGLVGTGRIGQIHARTLAHTIAGAELVAVTDVNREAAQACAAALGGAKVVDNYNDLLKDPTMQAVVICSSTDTHAPFIIQAAEAGKHIFCEKPIAADLSKIDAALDAVERAGVKLMIAFNRRFDANHQRLKQAIEGGEIGTPHRLHIISRDPAPPPIEYIKVSGGLFFDMTIHDFDMARFLLGDVDEVYAAGGVLVDPRIGEAGDIDTAVITLKFKNGAIGTIENSRKAVYGYDQRVEVFGSKGAARSDNWYPNAVTFSSGECVGRDLPLNFFLERYMGSYQHEMELFIQALNQGRPMPVTGQDGRAPVVIAMAALKSLQENRPVKLAEIR